MCSRLRSNGLRIALVAFLLFLLLSALALAALVQLVTADDGNLPTLEGLVRVGCVVDEAQRPEGIRYVVLIWAEHRKGESVERDWSLLYAVRKKRVRALRDCDGWLERVKKATREGNRSDAR